MRDMRLLGVFVLAVVAGCASAPEKTPAPAVVESGGTAAPARATVETFDPEKPLSLEDCVRLAETSSLTARSFKARLDAARGAATAAAAWPNPTIEYTAEDIGLVADHQRQLLQQQLVGYPVLTFWTKFLETDVANAELARSLASVEDDKRLLRQSVGQAFFELLASDEAVKNQTEAVAIATKLAEAAETRRRVGDASALDARRAQAEALEARRDLAAATRKRTVDGIAFALVLGAEKPVPVTLVSGWPLELPSDIASESTAGVVSLVERALAQRPDLQEAEATVLRATRSVELEERRTLPLAQWTLSGGAREGPLGFAGVVVFGGPVPVLDWNGGNKTRARAELEGAVADLERARRQAAFDVEAAVVTYREARSSLEEFARPIARAREEALESTRRLFAAGELGYLDLLQAQRDAVAARRDRVEAEKDVAMARWKLLVAAGR